MEYLIKKLLSCVLFVCASYMGFGQDAEQVRAKNYLALQALLTMQLQAPYYLTPADLAQIAALQPKTAAEICKAVKTSACQAVLPVTGLVLKGMRLNNEKVKLDWETKAEYNSRGFVLERQSIYNTALYDSIVFVTGAGTSYSKSDYSFTDLNNYRGSSFYRIKQVDNDGRYTYSNTVEIAGYTGRFELAVAPNPAMGNDIKLYLKGLDIDQAISLVISSSVGVQVFRKDGFSASDGLLEIRQLSLPSGYYFVTVTTASGTFTKPFSVIR